jgi:hypothetical protein
MTCRWSDPVFAREGTQSLGWWGILYDFASGH